MLTHEIPEKVKQEELVQYAESLSDLYARTYDAKVRKLKGQFFTPKQVSTYMASLFEIHHDTIRLLDAGAGTGILTAAFCERLLCNSRIIELTIDAYENDPGKNHLFLIEAVTAHGPLSPKRQIELEEILKHSGARRIYVSAFPDFREFKRHVDDIAWDTEVWIENNPDHMIHFNGPQFFTVYGD